MTLQSHQTQPAGFSLVESLVVLVLMGFLCVSIANFFIKSNLASRSLDLRFKEASEVHSLILDLQRDFQKGVYISQYSHQHRLEYTTYDASGQAVKKIYRIITESGAQYLQYSADGGASWGSPYRISTSYKKYQLAGTPQFLYAQAENNCTLINDADNNGIWEWWADDPPVNVSCPNSVTSSIPEYFEPYLANKVVLHGFQFTTRTGQPEATRNLPDYIFLSSPSPLVCSQNDPVAPSTAKDTASPMAFWYPSLSYWNSYTRGFSSSFGVRALVWDADRQQLILAGYGTSEIYSTDRHGYMRKRWQPVDNTMRFDGIALETDGNILQALDSNANKLYRFNLQNAGGSGLSPVSTLSLPSTYFTAGQSYSIAFDAATPTDCYIAAIDKTDNNLKIIELNATTGTLVNTWSLPSGITSTYTPNGLFIEPVTGDFIVARNYIGIGANQLLTIYRIFRSSGLSTSFTINVSDIGVDSSLQNSDGFWSMAYDPESNHLFLGSDGGNDAVYEVIPPVLISPRS